MGDLMCPSQIGIFTFGVIGAAAPEIFRIYNLRTMKSGFSLSVRYIGMSLPFFVLGGVFAVALSASNPCSAMPRF
jgi:hypothetical protein